MPYKTEIYFNNIPEGCEGSVSGAIGPSANLTTINRGGEECIPNIELKPNVYGVLSIGGIILIISSLLYLYSKRRT